MLYILGRQGGNCKRLPSSPVGGLIKQHKNPKVWKKKAPKKIGFKVKCESRTP